jgi:hypothetical protein
MTKWVVTETLACENHPVLAAVYLSLTGEAYMAVRISTGATAPFIPDRSEGRFGTGLAAPGGIQRHHYTASDNLSPLCWKRQ